MLKEILSWLFGFCLIIIIWQLGNITFSPNYLPSPYDVFASIANNYKLHLDNVSQTAYEALTGMILSIFISAIIIVLVGAYPRFETIIYPLILIIKSTPAVAIVPIFILITGIGVLTKIFVAALICFFPLIIGGIDGIKRTPPELIILGETFGTQKLKSFLHLKIGYVINGFCSGLKTAAPLSVIGAIVGEYVTGGSQTGLGSFIIANSVRSVKINLYAGAILSSFIGIIFFIVSNLIANEYDKRLRLRI